MAHNTTLCAAAVALSVLAAGCTTTASTSTAQSGNAVTGTTASLTPQRRQEINQGYGTTLDRVYQANPGSRELVAKARGVLVFPNVIEAGLVVGAEYGQGVLKSSGTSDGYYRITSGSVGWTIGAQSRSLVVLFMTQDALDKFRSGNGWSGGIDASVAVLKAGANGTLDVNAARAPTVAFVMTNAGLMADLSLQGTKVTRIE